MAKRRPRHHHNPDFRHRVPGPLPDVAEIEAELTALADTGIVCAAPTGTTRPA